MSPGHGTYAYQRRAIVHDACFSQELSEARVGESAYWAIAIPVMIAAGEADGFGLRTGLSKM